MENQDEGFSIISNLARSPAGGILLLISGINTYDSSSSDIQKERNSSMSAGKVFLGFVIGMATGATLGVLFAPDKGTANRKKLSKQGGALMNTASEYVDNLEEKFEGVREAAIDLSDKVKGAVDSLAGHEPQKHTRRT